MSSRAAALTSAACLYLLVAPSAQTLIRDIGTQPDPRRFPSDPRELTPFGGGVLFSGQSPGTGFELFFTDGTAAGSRPAWDVEPGYRSSNPTWITPFGASAVLFTAETSGRGRELWIADSGGPRSLGDLRPGPLGSLPQQVAVIGSRALFVADDGVRGAELWVTDGTAAGTRLVADLTPGPTSARFVGIVPWNGRALVFTADPARLVATIWDTDGTLAGTRSVVAQPIPDAISLGGPIGVVGNRVLFNGFDPQHGFEPWVTDGTAAGTLRLADVAVGPASSMILRGTAQRAVDLAGGLVFLRTTGLDEVWISDGTVAGTRALATSTVLQGYDSVLMHRVASGDLLWITRSVAGPMELWQSNGQQSGTAPVLRLPMRFPPSYLSLWSAVNNGVVYFNGDIPGDELWRSDGTVAGTQLVAGIAPATRILGLATVGSRVVFAAREGEQGDELWASDGTSTGTQRIPLNSAPVNQGSEPALLGRFRGRSYWATYDGANPWRLWESEGTSSGTRQITAGARLDGVSAVRWCELDDAMLFVGYQHTSGAELWRFDTTATGTRPVLDIRPGAFGSSPARLVVFKGRAYFDADDGRAGRELWSSDGTSGGTGLVVDLRPGADGSQPHDLVVWNDQLWFIANHPTAGEELFVSDGTAAGTRLVIDLVPGISPGLGSSEFGPALVGFGNALYFAGYGPSGRELWRTDGTAAGTQLVRDLYPEFFGSGSPTGFQVIGGRLVMLANGVTGRRLWASDGTGPGTVPLATFQDATGVQALDPNTAMFFARENDNPSVLWRTDGTAAGTQRLGVLNPAATDWVAPVWSKPGRTRLLFNANDGVHGDELWVTDGTWAGTRMVADIAPVDARPRSVVRAGNRLVFTADDGRVGNELHAIELVDLGEHVAEPVGSGCSGSSGAIPAIDAPRPVVQSAAWRIDLSAVPPTTPVALLIGTGAVRTPIPTGCALWTAPVVALPATSDASGRATIGINPTPGLAGAVLVVQYVALDVGGSMLGQFSATSGLEFVVGR